MCLTIKDDFKVLFTGESYHVPVIKGVLSAYPKGSIGGTIGIHCDDDGNRCYPMYRCKDPVIDIKDPDANSDELEIIRITFTTLKSPEYLHDYLWLHFFFEERDILKVDCIVEDSEDDYESFEFVGSFKIRIKEWNESPEEILVEHPYSECSLILKVERY